MSFRRFFTGLLLLLAGWHFADWFPLPTPRALALAVPDQVLLDKGAVPSWDYAGFRFIPLATYTIQARLLHREPYYIDGVAGISPCDFALGWGRMSDPTVYNQLSITQGGRWFLYWLPAAPPIPGDEVLQSSANTHIIPASPEVVHQIAWLRAGDVIKLSGYLVEVDGPGSTTWRSSLTRTDSGAGACEIMWVNHAEKVGR